MSGVDAASSKRRTEDLVDDWAHDAGLVGKDEHVKARAGLQSSSKAWGERNEATPGEAMKGLATGLAKEAVPELANHAVVEGHGAMAVRAAQAGRVAGGGLAAVVVAGTVVGAYELFMKGWAEPHQKGDAIRALQHNDAVNVVLAQELAFDERFGAYEAASRPGVEKGTAMLRGQLDGKDAALRPILQARADEGFVAQERAYEATKHLGNTPARAEAMQKWMKDNGFEDRRRNDVAFGKGVEYFDWVGAQRRSEGIDACVESKKVHERVAPKQPFACRG
ncbi:MAG: hypothetical protein JWP87_2381 [Labilithrix sp.]|nr:hypothetical protein [Labilithrix sp.]